MNAFQSRWDVYMELEGDNDEVTIIKKIFEEVEV